jgi:hypothetical protein
VANKKVILFFFALVISNHSISSILPLCDRGFSYGYNTAEFEVSWKSLLSAWMTQIPPISPREEEWLNSELESGDFGRVTRARKSTEFYLKESRRILGNMLYIFEGDYPSLEKYIFLSSELISYEQTGQIYILRLTESGAITLDWISKPSDRLSGPLQLALKPDPPYSDFLNELQKHILRCFMPQLLEQ